MAAIEHLELEIWRLIVLDQHRREIWLTTNDALTFSLPVVEISGGQRIAEALTTAVRNTSGLNTLCLLIPTLPELTKARYAVLESLPSPSADSNWRTVALHELVVGSFQHEEDFRVLQQVLAELKNRESEPSSPFTKQGWFEELRTWIVDSLQPLGLKLTGDFQQLNGCPCFSLIRFETTGPDIWFKAVGEPNLREFPIALELSGCLPGYLPKIIGQRSDWNGWLSFSAGTRSLSDTNEIRSWEAAARALGELQLESIGSTDAILQAGAHDLRMLKLSELVQPFLDVVRRLMREQTKESPSPLSDEDLELLALRLQDAITLLEDLRIPETLGHLDLNPGNIVPGDEGCTFLDWAEAYIGHPFFSFEYLLAHRRKAVGPCPEVESSLLAAYLQPWSRTLPKESISEAFAFVPLVAVFAYAASLCAWHDREALANPNVAGYLRSLARRMNHEAVQLIDRRMPCLS